MQQLLGSRLRWLRLLPAAILVLLGLRLWQLQVVRGAELRLKATQNRFAIRELEADRGVIYDRVGRRVVLNRPQFALRIVPAALPKDPAARNRILRRVAEVLTSVDHAADAPSGSTPPSVATGTAPAAGTVAPGESGSAPPSVPARPPGGPAERPCRRCDGHRPPRPCW